MSRQTRYGVAHVRNTYNPILYSWSKERNNNKKKIGHEESDGAETHLGEAQEAGGRVCIGPVPENVWDGNDEMHMQAV